MEIPGIAPFSGQPTITNPPTQETELATRVTPAQSDSETQNTVSASEQSPSSLSNTAVVNQVDETEQAGFNPDNPGGTIDLTA